MGRRLEKVCNLAVEILSGIFLIILCLWSVTNGYNYPTDYSAEYLLGNSESLGKYLFLAGMILLAVGVLVRGLLHGADEKKQKKIVTVLAAVLLSINAILLLIWIPVAQIEPDRDAAQVLYTTQDFLQGNYEPMTYTYLRGYQHQCGLIILEEMIMRLVGDYRIFQYINVLFVVGIQWILYRICHEFFKNYIVDIYCLVGSVIFLPLQLYVNLVYGDVCSLFLALLTFWLLMQWRKSGKWPYAAASVVTMILAVMVRENTLIFLIALVITLVLETIRKKDWRPVGTAVILVLCTILVTNSIPGIYEKRSGIEMGDAMPALLWVSMGLQAEWGAYGVYNGYNVSVFWEEDGNAQQASARAVEDIRKRMGEFAANKAIAYDFYKNKMCMQWGEGTLGSLIMTSNSLNLDNSVVYSIYYGKTSDRIRKFTGFYNFFIYLGALLYVILTAKDGDSFWKNTLLLFFVGGFLFSILWEAKSRYVMPYIVCLIPYMAAGAWELQEWVWKRFEKIRLHLNRKYDNIKSA